MGEPEAAGHWVRRALPPTLLVSVFFLALQPGLVPHSLGRWASELAQLALAATAATSAFRAAARGRALARSFWSLIGLGMASWAVAQGLWASTTLVAPSRTLEVVRDLMFMASTAPLIGACVLRPHRPRPAALGLAADVGLVSALVLYIYAYFPVANVLVRGADPYGDLGPLLYNPQRLLLLGSLLWLLHGAEGPWRRVYDELALAMVVFLGGGVVSNLAVLRGAYRPGLYDLPWALPFAWIALAAGAWQPSREPDADDALEAAAWQARDWQDARQGHVVGLTAAVMVPTVHFLATLVGGAEPEVARLQGRIALLGTVLVGMLYLARQLGTLRRAEVTQRVREERFRALVENSSDAIGQLDEGGAFSYLSASTERVTGHRAGDLVGTSPLALVHPDERDCARRGLLGVCARAGATSRGFLRYRHRDGGYRHGAIDATNRLNDPAVSGVVLHFRDVTERRRAEEGRERSLSLLEATLESTADGILAVDGEGRIERFNRK
ncbi:MAG TPA: PAS domain S-box protein, partial [Vicinamibacteria bacterium]|nr:PAS domain S-box protein [Vicinamibacteria bacterium]